MPLGIALSALLVSATFFSLAPSVVSAAASMPPACEASFKSVDVNSAQRSAQLTAQHDLAETSPNSSPVFVLKFDVGAGFVRVVSGRMFMTERDSLGNVTSVEVFHDRGTGRYDAADVFHLINWPSHLAQKHQWRKALGRDGYARVHLIAADRDGVRFIGRTEQGDLKFYQAHELFPIASSNR